MFVWLEPALSMRGRPMRTVKCQPAKKAYLHCSQTLNTCHEHRNTVGPNVDGPNALKEQLIWMTRMCHLLHCHACIYYGIWGEHLGVKKNKRCRTVCQPYRNQTHRKGLNSGGQMHENLNPYHLSTGLQSLDRFSSGWIFFKLWTVFLLLGLRVFFLLLFFIVFAALLTTSDYILSHNYKWWHHGW
jgi:hypothetical protein